MKSTSPHLVVVGSSNTDLVLRCPRLPKPGETLLAGEFSQVAGGKGANQAVAAARAGAKVTFIGAYGDDDFGRAAKAQLKSENIDLRHFHCREKTSSGVALILIGGKDRQNMIAVARSANDTVSPADVELATSIFRRASAVVCQLEIPLTTVEASGNLARAYNVPFILNPAPAKRLPARLLKLVHTLTPNETEAERLTGESQPLKAARRLRELGCENVIVTLGPRGALLVTRDQELTIPAPRTKPVDTVGAGDCFTAWYSVGIAEGLSPFESASRAVQAAALKVTRAGAQAGMPFRNEVLKVR